MTVLTATLAVALALDLAPRPAPAVPKAGHAPEETRCGACHTAEGWDRVAFDHARTGFPLDGQHRVAPCRGCHAGSDFKRAVPSACVACHRDAHAGRMGTRCADCHQADLLRAALVSFDHVVAFGNADDCRRCHGAWAFSPGYLPGHDACFPIRSGPHAGMRCLRCHTAIPDPVAITGCNSLTAACYRCHSCAGNAGEHGGVGQYGSRCPVPDSCYGCHGSSFGGG